MIVLQELEKITVLVIGSMILMLFLRRYYLKMKERVVQNTLKPQTDGQETIYATAKLKHYYYYHSSEALFIFNVVSY